MPRIGLPELIIILVVVLIIFGVGRLADIGGGLGRAIREFRKAQSGENEGDGRKPNRRTAKDEGNHHEKSA